MLKRETEQTVHEQKRTWHELCCGGRHYVWGAKQLGAKQRRAVRAKGGLARGRLGAARKLCHQVPSMGIHQAGSRLPRSAS